MKQRWALRSLPQSHVGACYSIDAPDSSHSDANVSSTIDFLTFLWVICCLSEKKGPFFLNLTSFAEQNETYCGFDGT